MWHDRSVGARRLHGHPAFGAFRRGSFPNNLINEIPVFVWLFGLLP